MPPFLSGSYQSTVNWSHETELPLFWSSQYLQSFAASSVLDNQAPGQLYYSGIQIMFNTPPYPPTDPHLALRVSLSRFTQSCCFCWLAASIAQEVHEIFR